MKSNPTTLFLTLMLTALFIVAGYLILSDPFAGMPPTQTSQMAVQQNQNQLAMNLYLKNCAVCHGAMGQGKGGNPSLQNTPFTQAQIEQIIRQGRGNMPSFPQFSPEELKSLSRLIKQF